MIIIDTVAVKILEVFVNIFTKFFLHITLLILGLTLLSALCSFFLPDVIQLFAYCIHFFLGFFFSYATATELYTLLLIVFTYSYFRFALLGIPTGIPGKTPLIHSDEHKESVQYSAEMKRRKATYF